MAIEETETAFFDSDEIQECLPVSWLVPVLHVSTQPLQVLSDDAPAVCALDGGTCCLVSAPADTQVPRLQR